jgi:site-specific DNA-methyltransferase (adenine-specific)
MLFREYMRKDQNILIQGDSTKKDLLPKNCCDLIVTSPPYNLDKRYNNLNNSDNLGYEEYLTFSNKWISNCFYWIRDTGRMCINVCTTTNKGKRHPLSADLIKIALSIGWKYHTTIIWNKNNVHSRTAWGSWKSASAPNIMTPVEVIIVFYKNNWKREKQGKNDITQEEFVKWVLGYWNFGCESKKRIGHEAPFPRELPKRCIKLLSFQKDIILDPFAGSGTTMIETIENNRFSIAIEKEKHYCNLIKKRLRKECNLMVEKKIKDNIFLFNHKKPKTKNLTLF